MPDDPQQKLRPHPARQGGPKAKWHRGGSEDAAVRARRLLEGPPPKLVRAGSTAAFAELCCASNFTFLTGASHPDELARRAAELGYAAFGVCDTNTLAGVVRAHVEAGRQGVRQVVGSRVELQDGTGVYVWPTDLASYGRLSTLLTVGNLRAAKGRCALGLWDLLEHAEGQMLGVEVPARIGDAFVAGLRTLQDWCGGTGSLSLIAARDYGPDDEQRLRDVARLSREERVPMLATNRPLYHVRGRRLLQDVVSCVRRGCTLDEAGPLLEPSAERHMKVPEEIDRLFARHPRAVARTIEVAERCRGFSLDQLRYQYPSEVVPKGKTAMQALRELAEDGLIRRFPEAEGGVPARVRRQFAHELELIEELDLPHYFLTVEDLVRWSRLRGIPVPGPGRGGEQRRLLQPGRDRRRPAADQHALRAVHQPRPRRAAGHRRRLRARPAGGGDPVSIQEVRPRPCGADGERHHLPRPVGGARGREGAGPRGRRDRPAGEGDQLVEGRPGRGRRAGGAAAGPGRRDDAALRAFVRGDPGLPAAFGPAPRRVRADRDAAAQAGPDRQRRDARPDGDRVGQG